MAVAEVVPLDENKVEELAKTLLPRHDYSRKKTYRIYGPPDSDPEGEWQMLFEGRYEGNSRANTVADPKGETSAYTLWIKFDRTAYVTVGW